MEGSAGVIHPPHPVEPPKQATAGVASEADKGLKSNAIGLLSSIVIGVASTAPAYSLAVTLGLITAVMGIGLKSPAIMIVSFVPMMLTSPGCAKPKSRTLTPPSGNSMTFAGLTSR